MERTQYYSIKAVAKDKSHIELNDYVIGDITFEDEDGLLKALEFTLIDKTSAITDAVTIGAELIFTAGTLDDSRELLHGHVTSINPKFQENGELHLMVSTKPKEWKLLTRTVSDLLYPSANHPKNWAQQQLKASQIIKNMTIDAGLKVGNVDFGNDDLTYDDKSPVKQHRITDWRFMQDIAEKSNCTMWTEKKNNETLVHVMHNSILIGTISPYTIFYPYRRGTKFVIEEAKEDWIQAIDADVTLDSDEGLSEALSVSTDGDGHEQVHKDDYNEDTKEWNRWILDDEKLGAEFSITRDALISLYEAGNLGWEEVKPYFYLVGSVRDKSSREATAVSTATFSSSGDPTKDGVTGKTMEPEKKPDPRDDQRNYTYNNNKLGALSPERKKVVLAAIERHLGGQNPEWGKGTDGDVKPYFDYKEVEDKGGEAHKEDEEAKSKVDTTGKQKKKRDAGFKIELNVYGDLRVKPRYSYNLLGLSKYSGTYYLYKVKMTWGDSGFLMKLTFVK